MKLVLCSMVVDDKREEMCQIVLSISEWLATVHLTVFRHSPFVEKRKVINFFCFQRCRTWHITKCHRLGVFEKELLRSIVFEHETEEAIGQNYVMGEFNNLCCQSNIVSVRRLRSMLLAGCVARAIKLKMHTQF
jgi:hypothetical protein